MHKFAFLGVSLIFLGACVTNSVEDAGEQLIMAPEKGLIAARGAHYMACSAVESNHNIGILTGASFNKAKKACLDSDAQLDAADALLALGKLAESVTKQSLALDTVAVIQTEGK